MKDKTPKKIVYEKRLELISALTISWGFVIIGVFTEFNWGTLFFGLGALSITYRLIDPRKKIIFIGTKGYKEHMETEYQTKLKDHGIFTYLDHGFHVTILDQTYNISWTNILAIFAYKVDLYAVDEICMDIFCENNISFRVTEETLGWYIFLDKISEQFPTIEKNWSFEIAFPPFETNLTLLYEKENKTLEKATTHYYKDIKK